MKDVTLYPFSAMNLLTPKSELDRTEKERDHHHKADKDGCHFQVDPALGGPQPDALAIPRGGTAFGEDVADGVQLGGAHGFQRLHIPTCVLKGVGEGAASGVMRDPAALGVAVMLAFAFARHMKFGAFMRA